MASESERSSRDGVALVYSEASATSLAAGNKGHTPDPPQQDPLHRQASEGGCGRLMCVVMLDGAGLQSHQ